MIKVHKSVYSGSGGRLSQFDFSYESESRRCPLIIFCHGYKGFKDWGPWNEVSKKCVRQGFSFLKFNFSHNGGTSDNGIDFPDLEAFSNNNYCRELEDLKAVFSMVVDNSFEYSEFLDKEKVYLIGHSRGGSIAILFANSEKGIKKIVTWSAVSDFEGRFPQGEELAVWKNSGMRYILNGRTRQNMPLSYQFYENYILNRNKLNIRMAAKHIHVPFLVVHGENDQVVNINEAENLHSWNENSILEIIPDSGHTYSTRHPWEEEELSKAMENCLQKTLSFLKK